MNTRKYYEIQIVLMSCYYNLSHDIVSAKCILLYKLAIYSRKKQKSVDSLILIVIKKKKSYTVHIRYFSSLKLIKSASLALSSS